MAPLLMLRGFRYFQFVALHVFGISKALTVPSMEPSSSNKNPWRPDAPRETIREEYPYSDLKTRTSIRLLILQFGSAASADVICELVEVQLETEEKKIKKPRKENGSDASQEEQGRQGTKRKRSDHSSTADEARRPSFKNEKEQHGLSGEKAGTKPKAKKRRHKQSSPERSSEEEAITQDHTPKEPPIPFLGDPGVPDRYEALSWSWGSVPWASRIYIHQRGEGHGYFYAAPQSLVNALKALRYPTRNRILWIDVICINQRKPDERNQQVSMMSEIYGQAQEVCVWLGEADKHSKIAFDFIRDEIIQLRDFDKLCDNPEHTPKWDAMLNLMKRPWFSRRWVVQEIALARKAKIYCGSDSLLWSHFADAVQLFVEVETATHRLSEVIQKDPRYYHVPRWFEYVSKLGASLLVDATGTLFRLSKQGRRQKLRSLEFLVSNLSIFGATEPRDTIYALLAIAKDTSPIPILRGKRQRALPGQKVVERLARFKAKGYDVDYTKPYVDICQEFIRFAIHQQAERTRALDIICRPWAPPPNNKRPVLSTIGHSVKVEGESSQTKNEVLPSWVPKLEGAAYGMFEHSDSVMKMGRQNADPLVGLPSLNQRNYSAAGDRTVSLARLRFKKRDSYYSMYAHGFILDKIQSVETASQNGNIPSKWFQASGWDRDNDRPTESFKFDEFWRTLVADRAREGKNPPTYYARAFKLSLKRGLSSGSLNTTELIEHGRSSVVAEFFRRVQAVIWNRRLIHTTRGNLGIANQDVKANDLVCILHGCSVPVILRPIAKSKDDLKAERRIDETDLKENEHTKELLKKYCDQWKRWVHKRKQWQMWAIQNGVGDDSGGRKKKEPWKGDIRKPRASKDSEDVKRPPWLRNNPRSFYCEFLGECYVHGIMDGEAVDIQGQSVLDAVQRNDPEIKITDQVFELR